MAVPIYVVDAFSSHAFAGNPAGVCLLEEEREANWMQSVAAEMKHAETAFVRAIDGGFSLRWFTPTVEVDLCGHATLASAHILWETGAIAAEAVATFHTRSGVLTAEKHAKIQIDFPSEPPTEAALPFQLEGLNAIWTGKNRMDWLIEVGSESEVREYIPNLPEIVRLGNRGLQLTARGEGEFDFISRFFGPQSGVDEDPVTGSAHCCLGPFWGGKLQKASLHAFQASLRGGEVDVILAGDRVKLLGDATTVLEGRLKC